MKFLKQICFFTLTSAFLFGGSDVRDIYQNQSETRRKALDSEFEMALDLGGCAGVLIAPTTGLSAAHCKKSGAVRSGIALRDGAVPDGTIVRTLEVGSFQQYDYWIFEIQWKKGELPHGMRVVPFIQTREDDLKMGANDSAEKIYTLGFPQDISNGKLIYSWGYGKKTSKKNLVNNISLINGNSGGGILKSTDNMLVSIVSGGPHMYGEWGWNNSDWNDSSHWNWGPAMWQVYEKSPLLKSIFPNGKNKY